MQFFYFGVQFRDGAIVADNIVGVESASFPVHLRRHDTVDLGIAQAIACSYPRALHCFRHIDQQYPVDQCLLAGLEQQRNDKHDIRCRGLFGPQQHGGTDPGVQYGFEPASRLRILEHRFAQLRTVEAAIGIQYLLTKTGDDLAQRGLAGFDQFAAEDIRVDDLCAEAGEMIAGGRLAAADSPGQADFEQLQPNPASCR